MRIDEQLLIVQNKIQEQSDTLHAMDESGAFEKLTTADDVLYSVRQAVSVLGVAVGYVKLAFEQAIHGRGEITPQKWSSEELLVKDD